MLKLARVGWKLVESEYILLGSNLDINKVAWLYLHIRGHLSWGRPI